MEKIDFIKKAQELLLDEYNTDMCYVRIDDVIRVFEKLGMLPPETRLIKRKALRDVISGEIIDYMETSSQLLNVWEDCYGE